MHWFSIHLLLEDFTLLWPQDGRMDQVWPFRTLYFQWSELLVQRWAYELLIIYEKQQTVFCIVGGGTYIFKIT